MTARVVYSMNVSLDGYVNGPDGSLDWSVVDPEIHSFWNEQVATPGADVYGRRLYETMAAYWPTATSDPAATPVTLEFARVWNAKPRIVFSRTLDRVIQGVRLVRGDIADEIDALREEFDGELQIGGPTIASRLIERNLVDEYRIVVHPAVLGGGLPFFPRDVRLDLALVDSRKFSNGLMLLVYRPR